MIFRINFTKYILLLVSFSFLTANSLNQSLNKFSIDLFKEINKNEDKNILISPLSVSYALMMVNKGASGNTSDNILSTLNIRSSDINKYYSLIEEYSNNLLKKLPITEEVSSLVYGTRNEISSILHGRDDRLLVICGPCSIHDPVSAIEYASKLKEQYNIKEMPVMPISANMLKSKYKMVEGKALGNKLKMIEEEWVKSNFQISEKQVDIIVNN